MILMQDIPDLCIKNYEIQVRTQNKQNYNFLLIRPDEKPEGKYVHWLSMKEPIVLKNFKVSGLFH